jgi:hypothetical protein
VDVLKSNAEDFQLKFKEFIDQKFIVVNEVDNEPKYVSNTKL